VVAAATAAGGVEEDLFAGQIHQAMTVITSTAATAAAIGTTLRRRRGTAIGTPAIGNSATASGDSA